MKYIRTWYGKLFGVAGLSKTGKSVFYISKKSGKQCQMPRNSRDRIADTIEELCDLFIGVRQDNFKVLIYPCDLNHAKNDKELYGEIHGAVWTNRGLIYVAKMNEKGELELL